MRKTERRTATVSVNRDDGRIVEASPELERLIGWHPDQLKHLNLVDASMIHPDDVLDATRLLQASEAQLGVRVRHLDGSWVSLQVHAVANGRNLDLIVEPSVNYNPLLDEAFPLLDIAPADEPGGRLRAGVFQIRYVPGSTPRQFAHMLQAEMPGSAEWLLQLYQPADQYDLDDQEPWQ